MKARVLHPVVKPEVELKLQIPAHQRSAVRAAMLRGRCTSRRLRALYFDSPDGALADAGFVLRLRREGRQWVQAVKRAGDGPLSRLEHEVVLGAHRSVPALEVARHAESHCYKGLLAALGPRIDTLAPVFEVQVQRRHRLVRHEGAWIELALDEGAIVDGRSRAPIHELELELKSGPLSALTSLAQRWAQRQGLWLDVRSKSERGHLLVRQQGAQPATRGHVPALKAHAPADTALRAIAGAALMQILPNAAALASGGGGAEHVHQARIGLRRLLSVLREFGAWSADVRPQWSDQASAIFKLLGQTRDRDALSDWILPQLQAAGAPACEIDAEVAATTPAQVFRSSQATALMLELLAFAHGGPVPATAEGQQRTAPVLGLAAPRLLHLHRQLRRAGKAFMSMDTAARHRARKQLKRLRYCAESVSSVLPARAWADYARRLTAAQEALGRLQDVTVAQAVFSAQRDREPRAWFALGWLAARHADCATEAGRALRALGKSPKFMR